MHPENEQKQAKECPLHEVPLLQEDEGVRNTALEMHFLARERTNRRQDHVSADKAKKGAILSVLDADLLPDTDTVYPKLNQEYSKDGVTDLQMNRDPGQSSHGTAPWDDVGFSRDGCST